MLPAGDSISTGRDGTAISGAIVGISNSGISGTSGNSGISGIEGSFGRHPVARMQLAITDDAIKMCFMISILLLKF
tara:strand:+ start:389 stop:616 length:228 start_codon:yes stop_codon:yes gene_type:complete